MDDLVAVSLGVLAKMKDVGLLLWLIHWLIVLCTPLVLHKLWEKINRHKKRPLAGVVSVKRFSVIKNLASDERVGKLPFKVKDSFPHLLFLFENP